MEGREGETTTNELKERQKTKELEDRERVWEKLRTERREGERER